MPWPTTLTTFLTQQGWGTITAAQPVGGGCINEGRVLTTAHGPPLFLKQNASAPAAMFAREAEGLAALAAAPGGPRVPATYLVGDDFLLLVYLAPAAPAPTAWEQFGVQLAQLHQHTAPQFGFAHANYIGTTPQPNAWLADGWAFFAEQRLLFQGRLAYDRGLLSTPLLHGLERLAARLPELIPPQPASLLHGDLWSGNWHVGPSGQVCLIDPAAYYGWAEADLAMTQLFGRLPAVVFAAYTATRPLAPGYAARFEIYNLYHLLNHLNLFGRSYLAEVEGSLHAW